MKRQMEKDDQLRCCCNFHPDEVFVGVCPVCLYERLTVVASKRYRYGFRLNKSSSCKSSKPRIVLPKIFAMDSLSHRKNKKRFFDLKDSESRSNDGTCSYIFTSKPYKT